MRLLLTAGSVGMYAQKPREDRIPTKFSSRFCIREGSFRTRRQSCEVLMKRTQSSHWPEVYRAEPFNSVDERSGRDPNRSA